MSSLIGIVFDQVIPFFRVFLLGYLAYLFPVLHLKIVPESSGYSGDHFKLVCSLECYRLVSFQDTDDRLFSDPRPD